MRDATSVADVFQEFLLREDPEPENYDDVDEFCAKYSFTSDTTSTDVYMFTFVSLFIISVLGLLFIASTIFYNNKLQSHPQPMIAWICIAEACMSWNALMEVINPVSVICYFSFYRVFGITIFHYHMDQADQFHQLNTLCQSNSMFYSFFQLVSLTLNLCLCIDLIMTIYDPFSPAYRRTNLYYMFSITSSVVLVLIIFAIGQKQTDDNNIEYDCLDQTIPGQFVQIQDTANLVLAMTLSLYIVVAIYSTVYSYRRLHRPGVSAPVRSLFVKKHFLYVVVFIVIWMIQQSSNYYWLFNPQ